MTSHSAVHDGFHGLLHMKRFGLSDSPIQLATLREALLHSHAGAFTSFEGWVRDHNAGQAVSGLHYEAYAELAVSEGERILEEALQKFAIQDARCVHRTGDLLVGDLAVWVGVTAAHRGAAFDACRYLIDEVKSRVPIWKQEHYRQGEAGWLHPEHVPSSI